MNFRDKWAKQVDISTYLRDGLLFQWDRNALIIVQTKIDQSLPKTKLWDEIKPDVEIVNPKSKYNSDNMDTFIYPCFDEFQ